MKPIMATISKNLTSKLFSSTTLNTLSHILTTSSIEMSSPFTYILSLKVEICGDVNKPTLNPNYYRAVAVFKETDPFPFVPATWIILKVP